MNISFSWVGDKRRKLSVSVLISILCIVATSGCSESPKGPLEQLQAQAEYRDWKIYRHDRVNVLYPEGHPQEPYFESICEGYLISANRIARSLGMPPFEDTLHVVFYSGFGQGRELSGKHWPFVEKGVIHYWRPAFIGVTLADFMAQRWSPVWPSRDIFHHGLRTLLDFSGQNYHQRTDLLMDSNLFVPLADLALSPRFVSDSERVYSAEAASFVAYLLAAHGAEKFRNLYEAQGPFDSVVSEITGVGVDTLETHWLEFVKINLPGDTAAR